MKCLILYRPECSCPSFLIKLPRGTQSPNRRNRLSHNEPQPSRWPDTTLEDELFPLLDPSQRRYMVTNEYTRKFLSEVLRLVQNQSCHPVKPLLIRPHTSNPSRSDKTSPTIPTFVETPPSPNFCGVCGAAADYNTSGEAGIPAPPIDSISSFLPLRLNLLRVTGQRLTRDNDDFKRCTAGKADGRVPPVPARLEHPALPGDVHTGCARVCA